MMVRCDFRHEDPGITVAALTGELSVGNALTDIEFRMLECVREGARKVVVDLSGLTFIDSAGLGTVTLWAGAMSKQGGKLVLVGATGKVKQMFEITSINRVIGVYADLAAAVAAFAESSQSALGA